MRVNTSKDFNKVKKNAIDMATDLCYDSKCKRDLQYASNETQITNIMIAARRRCYES